MPTSYSVRTIPTTSYNLTRLGGEYLVTSSGDYITDSNGNRIIVLVVGGHLPYTQYATPRTYRPLTLMEITYGTLGEMPGVLSDYYTGIVPSVYSVRTPI